jgi:hypothetical protein
MGGSGKEGGGGKGERLIGGSINISTYLVVDSTYLVVDVKNMSATGISDPVKKTKSLSRDLR